MAAGDISETVEDMITLPNLTEESMLKNLRIRYGHDLIYTYTGSILVSVNPFQKLPIYTSDMVKKYCGAQLGSLAPHIFAVADAAYRNMLDNGRNQSVIISGESGAGKSEATKLILQYLAAMTKNHGWIEQQIVEAGTILEAFGNAKTVRNNNSSRFGKFIEIHFDKTGKIVGAQIMQYLLEKSRIVAQAADERNYHIFYELCLGASDEERQAYKLLPPEKCHYLNQSGCINIHDHDDVEQFNNVKLALTVIGIGEETQQDIFKVLSAILHLGNIEFGSDGKEGSKVTAVKELEIAAELLGVDPAELTKALTLFNREVRGQVITTPLKPEQARDTRDALAKALYGLMFNWLVDRINESINRRGGPESGGASTGSGCPDGNFIGVLDIFGFENFRLNSFEQLCINYANEKLQQYFNHHIFKLEQEEYAREKINWTHIAFTDNAECLDLIEGKTGILALLDEECRFPNGTDISFVQKLWQRLEKHKYFEKPRTAKSTFVVKHYAGDVAYEVANFLDKNRDTLNEDLVKVMKASEVEFVQKLFEEKPDPATPASSPAPAEPAAGRGRGRGSPAPSPGKASGAASPGGGGLKKKTVGAQFKEQLNALVNTLSATAPHYIRCIKPNQAKVPSRFESEMVLVQLRYSGMLETIRIRRAGYPIRYTPDEFLKKYKILHLKAAAAAAKSAPLEGCRAVLDALKLSPDEWKIGLSKVFLRDHMQNKLDDLRRACLNANATRIQRRYRTWVARRKFVVTRLASTVLQAGIRMQMIRRTYLRLRDSAWTVQSAVRKLAVQREFAVLRNSARVLQAYARCFNARRQVLRLRRGVVTLQKLARRFLYRRRYRRTRAAAIVLQSAIRGLMARREHSQKLTDKGINAAALISALPEPEADTTGDLLGLNLTLDSLNLDFGEMSPELKELSAVLDAAAKGVPKTEEQELAAALLELTSFGQQSAEAGAAIPGAGGKAAAGSAGGGAGGPSRSGGAGGAASGPMTLEDIENQFRQLQQFVDSDLFSSVLEQQLTGMEAAGGSDVSTVLDTLGKEFGGVGAGEMFDQLEELEKMFESELAGLGAGAKTKGGKDELGEFESALEALGKLGEKPAAAAGKPLTERERREKEAEEKRRLIGKRTLVGAELRGDGTAANTPGGFDVNTNCSQYQLAEYAKTHFSEPEQKGRKAKRVDYKELASYTKTPIGAPMLKATERAGATAHKEAVAVFHHIMSYMGDAKKLISLKSDSPIEQAQYVVMKGIKLSELRDEIYVQVMRQIHDNPKAESAVKGWQLFLLICSAFPPSATLVPYVCGFAQTAAAGASGEVQQMATNSLKRLQRTLTNGPRRVPPGAKEIDSIINRKPMIIKVFLMDNKAKSLDIDSATTAREVCQKLSEKLELKDRSGFALYEVLGHNLERSLRENDFVGDTLAKWEELEGKATTAKSRDNKFVFKRKVFLNPLEDPADAATRDLLFYQALHDVIVGNIPVSEQDAFKLASLLMQINWGDHDPKRNIIKQLPMSELGNYLPKKVVEAHAEEDWQKRLLFQISEYHALLKGTTADRAKELFMDEIRKWPLYGSTIFAVAPVGATEWTRGRPICLAVHYKGVYILDRDTMEPIQTYNYNQVEVSSYSADRFELTVLEGSPKERRRKKFTFETLLGFEIDPLVRIYNTVHRALMQEEAAASGTGGGSGTGGSGAGQGAAEEEENYGDVVLPPPVEAEKFKMQAYADDNFVTENIKFCFSKEPLTRPLHKNLDGTSRAKTAVELFAAILRFMGDDKKRTAFTDKKFNVVAEAQAIVHKGVRTPQLRNEILCQLMRQTCNNPSPDSAVRGWQLLALCLACFIPSKELMNFVRAHLQEHAKFRHEIGRYAMYAQVRLQRTILNGMRKNVPSEAEIAAVLKRKPAIVRVSLMDRSVKALPIDPSATVRELIGQIAGKLGMSTASPGGAAGDVLSEWGIYELVDNNLDAEHSLKDTQLVTDVLSKWEENDVDTGTKHDYKLVFKKKVFLNPTAEDTDPVARDLVFHQAVYNVVEGKYPVTVQEAAKLAALQIQIAWGDHNPQNDVVKQLKDSEIAGKLVPKVLYAQHKPEEWKSTISRFHSELTGHSADECRALYMRQIRSWPLYGCAVFTVKQNLRSNLPGEMWLLIGKEAAHLVRMGTREVLMTFNYVDIANWGPSTNSFFIMTGDLMQPLKFVFQTAQGNEISELLHFYINMIVSKKKAGA